MKKIIFPLVCMAIIFAALCAICTRFNWFNPSTDTLHWSGQLKGLKDWFAPFLIISFFTGFLPVYIVEALKAMKPAGNPAGTQPAPEIEPAATTILTAEILTNSAALHVGQILSFPDAKCQFKIKSLKLAA